MQSVINEPSPNAPSVNNTSAGGVALPSLNGAMGHLRQKSSRMGLGERQYSYDVATGSSTRIMPRSAPSPPLLHTRQYSEGALVEKMPPSLAITGRNASVSSLDTQNFGTLTGMENSGQGSSGGRRRHGHNHSRAHSHHHSNIPTPVTSKPASMMSIVPYPLG